MSDRYCIASGAYTNTAIWSSTKDGPGGASVPTVTDNQIYNKSVAVTGHPGGSSGSIVVGPNADVSFAFATATLPTFLSGKRLAVEGRLSFASVGGLASVNPGASVDVAEGGRLDIGNNNLTFYTSYPALDVHGTLDNRGEIAGKGTVQFYAATTGDVAHRVGRAPNVVIVSYPSQAGDKSLFVRFRNLFDVDSLFVQPRSNDGAPSLVLDFGTSRIRVGTLTFNWTHSDLGRSVTMIQDGPLALWGDIRTAGLATPTTVDWRLGDHASLAFVGTANQAINMPSNVSGQIWTVDKSAGLLDLASFNGFLQGRLRRLTVRAASSIDLSGMPPVLSETSGSWACYYGLKADAVTPDGPTTVAEHLREAMDSCENFGLTTIPAGKTLCAKSFNNHTGAGISGTGTLCVRHGGLADSGTIASDVSIRYFDRPVHAVLPATLPDVTAGTEFSVDLAGSLGDRFRLDWDDGTFTETTTTGIVKHRYPESMEAGQRTLCLTAVNDEGKSVVAKKTITLCPPPREPESPTMSGTVELESRRTSPGIPRGCLPAPYRITLAQGKRFMHDTFQLNCPMSESGRALANGSGLYLGRITFPDGRRPEPSEIVSASYTVYRLDGSDATVRTPIEGHAEIQIPVAEIILPETVVDENWTFDNVGYNFRHTPDDSIFSPFPKAGRDYLVVYTLRPLHRSPKIVFQYRVHVI